MPDPANANQGSYKLLQGTRDFIWGVEQRLEDWVLGWNSSKMPDLTGKVALVTGGNSGLGYETCKKLAERNAKVYLVARDRQNAEEAATKLRSELGSGSSQVIPMGCDLMSLANVERLVADFKARGDPLHILIANAGLFFPGPYLQTEDGFEQQLKVNYYSQVWMIMGLLDVLIKSGPSRIIWQTSPAERFGILDWNNLKGDKFKDSGMTPYGCSKLWMLMWSYELQRRLKGMGGKAAQVDVFAAHPGLGATPLMDKADSSRYWIAKLITAQGTLIGNPTWRGALPTLYTATEPSLQGTGFQIYGPNIVSLGMIRKYNPLNRVWKDSGLDTHQRLFEETERILRDVGHPLPNQLPPMSGPQPAAELAELEKQVAGVKQMSAAWAENGAVLRSKYGG